MKLTTKEIKKLVKEEIRKLLSEGSRVIIANFEDDGEEMILPFTKDGEILTAFSTSVAELLHTHFPEVAESEYGQKLIDKSGDDIEEMLSEEAPLAFSQFVEFMKALAPSFDVIRGNLQVADVGYTDIAVKLSVDGRSVVIDEENDEAEYDQDGDVEVHFGYTVTSDQLGELLEREAERHENEHDYTGVYLSSFEEGESQYGGQDYPTTGTLRINKVLEDINNGTLVIRFEDSDPPLFVVEKNRGF